MAANPHSNLVFDFPDPTPHFEFGDPVGGGGSPKLASPGKNRKGKRFGKGRFGKGRGGVGGGVQNDDSPSKQSLGSAGTVTTASASVNSSLGSPASGDLAAGPASAARLAPQRSSSPQFRLAGPAAPAAGSQRRALSSANSASGYVSAASEVSEFSFDRVTVATNETGPSSHVDWGFLDAARLGALGMGPDPGGAAGGTRAPPAADGGGARTGGRRHRPAPSASSLSNVSLSSDEDGIPVSGVADDAAGSVVSEMSERTRSHARDADAARVRAVLRDGMASAQREHRAEAQGPAAGRGARVAAKDRRDGGGAPTRGAEGHGAAARKETPFSDLRASYVDFRASRGARGGGRARSFLRSLAEDAQFCSLYFCGADTTQDADPSPGEDDRTREAGPTLLGTMIRCADGMGTCGAA